MNTFLAVILIAQVILSLGVGVWLFATRGPRKTFEEDIKSMSEDGLKTYRR